MGILEDILARLERIEAAVSADRKSDPTQTVAAPANWPQGALGVPEAPAASVPAPAPQPAYGPQSIPATPVAGPQAVPTLQDLTEKLLNLNEAQGEVVCLGLLRAHGGQDAEGSVSLKLVPEAEYLALGQSIDQQLARGSH